MRKPRSSPQESRDSRARIPWLTRPMRSTSSLCSRSGFTACCRHHKRDGLRALSPPSPLANSAQLLAQRFELIVVCVSVAIFEIVAVSLVGTARASGMFDRAPVLLGAAGNFHDVGVQAVCIGAVRAVDSFKQVEITEFGPVEHKVVGATDFPDPVHRKTHALV